MTTSQFVTKDSGERAEFQSGMQRDTEAGKPRFDLLIPEGVPYAEQFFTRLAGLMARGAEKYEDRNWEKADSEAEIARMKSSAFRHFFQWICGETDEDHAAAVVFNLLAAETIKGKIATEPKLATVAELFDRLIGPKPILEVGGYAVVTGDTMQWKHEFPSGERVLLTGRSTYSERAWICEYVDGSDWWCVREEDLKPCA